MIISENLKSTKNIAMKNNVFDCSTIELPKIHNKAGNITVIDTVEMTIPFEIKRVYYLYDVPSGESRGGHAHKELEQLIVAASGSFDVIIDDGHVKRRVQLNRPNYGLYIKSGIWRDLENFSSSSVLLVLASLEYSESDYIRDYEEFKQFRMQ